MEIDEVTLGRHDTMLKATKKKKVMRNWDKTNNKICQGGLHFVIHFRNTFIFTLQKSLLIKF